MALLTSEQRDMCADIAQRWANLKAWYGNPANASKPAIKKIKQNEGLFAKIEKVAVCKALDTQDVSAAGLLTPLFPVALMGLAFGSSDSTRPIDVIEAKGDLELLETFAIKDGFPKPTNYGRAIDATSVVGGGPTAVGVAQKLEDTVKEKSPFFASVTDPRRAYPGGPIDPTKGDPKSLCDPCLKEHSPLYCKVVTNACPEPVGIGDIPWWFWAIAGTGAVAYGTLLYASFKAAPYVMPIVAPQTAPFAQAWQQSRG